MIQYYAIPGLKYRNTEGNAGVVVAVCNYFGITEKELTARNRQQDIVEPRFIAMALLYKLSGWSKTKISKFFKKDHTTIIYGIKKCETLMKVDSNFRKDYLTIDQKLNNP